MQSQGRYIYVILFLHITGRVNEVKYGKVGRHVGRSWVVSKFMQNVCGESAWNLPA